MSGPPYSSGLPVSSSRNSPPTVPSMPASSSQPYPTPFITQQEQPQRSYSGDSYDHPSYHHAAPAPPAAGWGMSSAPSSPANFTTSRGLHSSPTDPYWPHGAAQPMYPSHINTGVPAVPSLPDAFNYEYGFPQRTVTPGSASIASTSSDLDELTRSTSALEPPYNFDYSPAASSALPSQSPLFSDSLRAPLSGPSRHQRGMSASDPVDHDRMRDKKKKYAKSFRDTEKMYFEQLRRRLFPTDPNTRRAECLERAIHALDELAQYKQRLAERDTEFAKMRADLESERQRAQRLENVIAQAQMQSSTGRAPQQAAAGSFQGYSTEVGWN